MKQPIVKVILKNQNNDKILLLGKQSLKELELKLQVSTIQEKLSLLELKKNLDEYFVDMSHFTHKGLPLLLVLGSKNSLRVFSDDKLMKKLNLDFDVLNYSMLDVARADSSYNQIVFGFNMMNEKEQKIYKDEMYSPRSGDQTPFNNSNNTNKLENLDKKTSHLSIPKEERQQMKKSMAVKLICVKDNFLILTNDMRFCFCKLDKFERKWDSIYNPLSILFPSNYQVLTSRPGSMLFSMSVNNRLSMLTFNLLIPTIPKDNHTEETVSQLWASNAIDVIHQSQKNIKSRFFRTVEKNFFKSKKNKKDNISQMQVNYKFKSYMLNILQLDTEELPLKPLQPVDSTNKATLDISIARSKNIVCYTDASSTLRLFSVNSSNEYKTALMHFSE
jgi:hypothetical protein